MKESYKLRFKSSVPGLHWPALPDTAGVTLMALLYQFEESQWYTPNTIQELQLQQAIRLLMHARQSVPYYREKSKGYKIPPSRRLNMAQWQKLPILTRSNVQDAGRALISQNIPRNHGRTGSIQTSGSTGKPLTSWQTEAAQMFWHACTVRNHLWHRHDFNKKFAVIRSSDTVQPGEEKIVQDWGPSTAMAFRTGTLATMHIQTDIARQAAWLQEQQASYLLSFPTNLHALAKYFRDKQLTLPDLREIISYGEMLDSETRNLCRKVWNVQIKDMYSAKEVGYIALQCPEHKQYHTQAENIIVEILDDEGQPCQAGQIGRVVLTPLHNFAHPLIRYEIGDYAMVGKACQCGRGLPVIQKIIGRQRNLLTMPDGRRMRPRFTASAWAGTAPIRQLQLIQETLVDIRAKVVTARPLQKEEEKAFIAALQKCLNHPFHIYLEKVQHIERLPSDKFEDFISKI